MPVPRKFFNYFWDQFLEVYKSINPEQSQSNVSQVVVEHSIIIVIAILLFPWRCAYYDRMSSNQLIHPVIGQSKKAQ
jgi:hypothetical protein